MRNFTLDYSSLFAAPDPQKKNRLFYWFWLGLLFLSGGVFWAGFLNWGRGPYAYHDWADITIPRLTFLLDGLRKGILPLHITDSFPLGGVTDQFLTIPDVVISPQIIFLKWMNINQFILVNFLIFYTVGFIGTVWLNRKLRLSPASLALFFLLFNFNGHILAHISLGHYTWTAYFFFPWLVGLVIELMGGKGGWSWALRVASLLLIMLLQGGYHQFIYSLFLLGFLVLVFPKKVSTLLGALGFSVLVSAFRLLPPFMNLGKFDNNFTAGYPMVQSFWDALVHLYIPNDFTINNDLTNQIGTWEYTLFIGILAAVFLVGFGFISAFRNRNNPGSYAILLLPSLGLAILSLDRFYKFLRLVIPLPLITGERVPARMISLAFILVLVVAVAEYQRWLNKQKPSSILALSSLGALLLVGNDLWQNFRTWRIPAAAGKYELVVYQAARWAPVVKSDPSYALILVSGLSVTILSMAALVYLTLWSRRSRNAPALSRVAVFRRAVPFTYSLHKPLIQSTRRLAQPRTLVPVTSRFRNKGA